MSLQVPQVSVLVPCRNEAKHIEDCLANIYGFAPPPGGFEVIVIDGMSNDGTRDILCRLKKRYPGLIVLDNLRRTVPYGMNMGIQRAQGEYIVRVDVRCIHPPNYLLDLIELSKKTKADNVGGVLVPISGETYVQKSIARTYKSRIAMGGALRDRGDFLGETDTVYGGCFKKSRLIEIGMYDEKMVRNQDDELSFRLRERGGKIIQDGRIKIQYFPRSSFRHLFRQFTQYGYWKVNVIKKHPHQASVRHFLPAILILGFTALGSAALLYKYFLVGLTIYAASYFLSIIFESLRVAYRNDIRLWPGVLTSVLLIHIGFGLGFLINLICRLLDLRPEFFETLSR